MFDFLKGLKIKVGRIWFWNVTHEWFAHQTGAGNREPHFPYVGVFQPLEPAWFRWNHSEISSGKIILLKWPQKSHTKGGFPCVSLLSQQKHDKNQGICCWKRKGNKHLVLISIQVWKSHLAQHIRHKSLKVNVSWWFKHVKMGRNFLEKNMLKIRLLEEIRLTTCNLWNRMKDGIFSVSTGAGFLPTTVSWWEGFSFGFMTLCFLFKNTTMNLSSCDLEYRDIDQTCILGSVPWMALSPVPMSTYKLFNWIFQEVYNEEMKVSRSQWARCFREKSV